MSGSSTARGWLADWRAVPTRSCSIPRRRAKTAGYGRSARRGDGAARGDRSSLVIAFGGGVVNDVRVFWPPSTCAGPSPANPTTLLAQVDAAIGGKTGVDLECGKNLVGAFHQPIAVLIDPEVLATLSEREYRAGLFESSNAASYAARRYSRCWGTARRSAGPPARGGGAADLESVRIKPRWFPPTSARAACA